MGVFKGSLVTAGLFGTAAAGLIAAAPALTHLGERALEAIRLTPESCARRSLSLTFPDTEKLGVTANNNNQVTSVWTPNDLVSEGGSTYSVKVDLNPEGFETTTIWNGVKTTADFNLKSSSREANIEYVQGQSDLADVLTSSHLSGELVASMRHCLEQRPMSFSWF